MAWLYSQENNTRRVYKDEREKVYQTAIVGKKHQKHDKKSRATADLLHVEYTRELLGLFSANVEHWAHPTDE